MGGGVEARACVTVRVGLARMARAAGAELPHPHSNSATSPAAARPGSQTTPRVAGRPASARQAESPPSRDDSDDFVGVVIARRATQRFLSFALNLKVTGPQGSGFWCTRISFWLKVIWPLA